MALLTSVLFIAVLLIQGFGLSEWLYGLAIFLLISGILEHERIERTRGY